MLPNPVPPLPLASGESAASRGCSSAPACDPSQAHLAVEASLDGDPRSAVPTSPKTTSTPVTAEALCGVDLGKKSLTDTNSPLLNPPHEPTQPHTMSMTHVLGTPSPQRVASGVRLRGRRARPPQLASCWAPSQPPYVGSLLERQPILPPGKKRPSHLP